MAHAAGSVLRGGECTRGCGCQQWHPPELDLGITEQERLALKYICEGCDHHLSFHSCGIDACGKKLMKKDAVGNSVFDSDGQEVVLGTCKCSRFIPDPNSKGQKFCHGCTHHTSFHLTQTAPVGVRRVPDKSLPSPPFFGESQSQILPPSLENQVPQCPSVSTPHSATPASAPVGKKQKTSPEPLFVLEEPNNDWVSAFTGTLLSGTYFF